MKTFITAAMISLALASTASAQTRQYTAQEIFLKRPSDMSRMEQRKLRKEVTKEICQQQPRGFVELKPLNTEHRIILNCKWG
jgi:hypothetical protein